jgi:hypothetical protein
MPTFKRVLLVLVLAFTILLGRPAQAAASEPVIICYYMGDVRNSYNQTGALWYCEMYDKEGKFAGSWYQVEPY